MFLWLWSQGQGSLSLPFLLYTVPSLEIILGGKGKVGETFLFETPDNLFFLGKNMSWTHFISYVKIIKFDRKNLAQKSNFYLFFFFLISKSHEGFCYKPYLLTDELSIVNFWV